MKRKTKAIISLIIVMTMVIAFIPFNSFKAIATTAYTVTFTVTEGTHVLEQSGDTDLGINGNFLALELGDRTHIGTFSKISDTEYILNVSSGETGFLQFNNNDESYSLFIGENQISAGYEISGNTNIEIKNYVEYQGEGNSEPDPGFNVEVQFDSETIVGNVVTYNVNNTNVDLTVNGADISEGRVQIDGNNLASVTFTLGNTYNNDTMQVVVRGADNYCSPLAVNNNEASLDGLNFPGGGLHLSVEPKNNNGGEQGGGNTQEYQGNATATLNYSVNGVIEYEVGPYEGLGINFSINEVTYRPDESKVSYTEDTAYERDENGQIIRNENEEPIPMLDPETMQPMKEKTGVTITGDTINYDSEGEKVKFVFMMNPGTLMTGLRINGQTINNLPSTSAELEACYIDHRLEIEVNNIDKADIYDIEIEARYPNSNEEFMGNFLWDYNPEGYTSPEDKILNATLTFVEAEYNGHKYKTEEEINSLGGVYIWNDAARKKNYTEEREGCGEAQFPIGTKLTVKIIPDAGYQLVDFGINGGAFDPQEEIGTYTFEVQGGPFHLQANIAQVEDVVKTKSEKIESGSIKLGGEEDSMAIGTARLEVEDVELNAQQISNFEEAAGGYEIKNYVDISLYNTVFKGKETASWDTQVKELTNEATITLRLEEGINVNEVAIVHEKHDGTFEIIEIDSYDEETNTITFKTKSFSNYAIASKAEIATEETKTATDEKESNPKTGDNIIIAAVVLVIAVLGTVIISKSKNKKTQKNK